MINECSSLLMTQKQQNAYVPIIIQKYFIASVVTTVQLVILYYLIL